MNIMQGFPDSLQKNYVIFYLSEINKGIAFILFVIGDTEMFLSRVKNS